MSIHADPTSGRGGAPRLTPSARPAAPDATYCAALGLAIFAFASLESRALLACERIAPGSTRSLAGRTAGNVADKLVDLAEGLVPDDGQAELASAARAFERLVRVRNALVHARPELDGDGRAQLSSEGEAWTIAALADAGESFSRAAERLERLLDGYLAEAAAPTGDEDA